MGELRARLIDVVAVHVLDGLLHGRVDGLLLRSGIAVAPRGRILVIDAVDVPGDGGAGVVVGLVLDESRNPVTHGDNCVDAGKSSANDGCLVLDREANGVGAPPAVILVAPLSLHVVKEVHLQVSFHQSDIGRGWSLGFDRSGRDDRSKVQEESKA
ncbi:MAG: hypothetical protein Q9181_000424 [Wetmoreana brouardii]